MKDAADQQFGKFRIDASHVFLTTDLSAAFVNLRPIVPGHVLVIPKRVVPRLLDLTEEETVDLWRTVRSVQLLLMEVESSAAGAAEPPQGFNVAVQDGRVAGQSVPHVHVHILPRGAEDSFAGERNDEIYDALEDWAPSEQLKASKEKDKEANKLHVPEDSQRRDRTPQEMAEEAARYRALVEKTKK